MRVAHLSSFRPDAANGVHAAVAQWAPSLNAVGVESEIWHFRRDRTDIAVRQEERFTVYELPFPLLRPGVSGYLRRVPRITAEWLAAAAERVDAFHVHSVFQPEAWAVRARLKKPFCVSPQGGYTAFHQRTLRQRAKLPLWLAAERTVVKDAAFFHAVSDGDATSIRRLRPDAEVVVIPNGVRVVNPSSRNGEAREWVFVGRLDFETKGLDLLLEAYARAANAVDLPKLMIYGPDVRRGRARVESLVAKLALADRVQVASGVYGADRDRVMVNAGLFVLTSRREGLPVAALEALGAGTPVLVTPTTNIGSLVSGADAGFVAPGTSVDAIRVAIEAAAATPAHELKAAGARGRAAVLATYRWETVAEQLAAAYERYFT
jgi:glycosyltransferase involved in cell wall biosynthesis